MSRIESMKMSGVDLQNGLEFLVRGPSSRPERRPRKSRKPSKPWKSSKVEITTIGSNESANLAGRRSL
jgi:hypothetical protein